MIYVPRPGDEALYIIPIVNDPSEYITLQFIELLHKQGARHTTIICTIYI